MLEDTYSTIGPECPYCGFEHKAEDDPEIYYSEAFCEHICQDCDIPKGQKQPGQRKAPSQAIYSGSGNSCGLETFSLI